MHQQTHSHETTLQKCQPKPGLGKTPGRGAVGSPYLCRQVCFLHFLSLNRLVLQQVAYYSPDITHPVGLHHVIFVCDALRPGEMFFTFRNREAQRVHHVSFLILSRFFSAQAAEAQAWIRSRRLVCTSEEQESASFIQRPGLWV